MSVFGFELKEIRNERKYSIPKMARLLGLTNKSYTDVEEGLSGSRSKNVQKIYAHSMWTTNERNRLLKSFEVTKDHNDQSQKSFARLIEKKERTRPNLKDTRFYEIEKELIAKHGKLSIVPDDEPLLAELRKEAGGVDSAKKPTGRRHTYRLNVSRLKELARTAGNRKVGIDIGKHDTWFYNILSTGRTTKGIAIKIAEYFGVSLEDISL